MKIKAHILIGFACLLLAGCSGSEDSSAKATKPEEVKLDMPKEQQDKLKEDFKNFDVKKVGK